MIKILWAERERKIGKKRGTFKIKDKCQLWKCVRFRRDNMVGDMKIYLRQLLKMSKDKGKPTAEYMTRIMKEINK